MCAKHNNIELTVHHVSPSIMKLIKNTIPQGPRVVSGLNTL